MNRFRALPLLLLSIVYCAAAREKAAPRSCQAACLSGNCGTGAGTQRYSDCGQYSGGFRAGLRHGPGEYTFPGGDRFEGLYDRDRRQGEGSYLFHNGDRFFGGFASATFVAPRTIRFADGAELTGTFIARAAAREGWRGGPLAKINGYGTLHRDDERRLCAAAGRVLYCDTAELPGRLSGTALGTAPEERMLLVLYSATDTLLKRGGSERPGQTGMLLQPGDTVQAGQYAIEIQAAGGTIIRLKPGSLLFIPIDFARTGLLELRQGGILVRTGENAKTSGRPLRIRSGGSVYTVNGTEFGIETDETGRISRVKVFSGEILMTPDVPALSRFTPEEIAARPVLRIIIEALENKPLRVGAGETAAMDESGRRWTEELNAQLEKEVSPGGQEKFGEPAGAREKSKFEETTQEASERKLLTSVSEDRFNSSVRAELKGGVTPAEAERVQDEYQRNLDRQAEKLSGDLSSSRPAKTMADLKRIYSTLEVITFHDGKKKAGSVVAQVGGLLILHSTDGVFRAKVAEVHHIDFYHQDGGGR